MVNNDNASAAAFEHDFFIQWHVTEKCNLHCKHCYQNGTQSGEMTYSEINQITAEVSEMLHDWSEEYGIRFSPGFNVTGGEPFLRQDIFKILENMKSRGFEINLLSNGTIIDKRMAGMLSEIGIDGVQVSIEGPEIINDGIRGKGSFALALKGVNSLLDKGLKVTLNVTLSNLNHDYIDELILLASKTGVQRLGFSRLVPSGRGGQLLGEMLSANRIKEIYDGLLNNKISGLEIVTGDPLASRGDLKTDVNKGCTAFGGCAAGLSGLTFQPDGTINPCRRLNIPIGNIRKDSLREVWANSEVLCRLRDKGQYNGNCSNCSRWASCRGCRAVAYAYSQSKGENDYLAEDPQCYVDIC